MDKENEYEASIIGCGGPGSTRSFLREPATLWAEAGPPATRGQQTGSEWNSLGRALEGELTGVQLERVVSIDHFWLSWAAFRPDTRVYEPQSAR